MDTLIPLLLLIAPLVGLLLAMTLLIWFIAKGQKSK